MYSMVIVALWAWTDLEIRRMQPYIDLVHGHATAEKSLLLDYTTTRWVTSQSLVLFRVHPPSDCCRIASKFFVWITAYRNNHYMVAAIAIIGIITLIVNPLAPAMFTIRNILWGPPRQHLYIPIRE
jgi:hypothetical protein